MENVNKITLKDDYIFKKIFGKKENKHLLKDLLEGILNEKIDTIDVVEEKNIEDKALDNMCGPLDIRAIVNDNILIDLEMLMRKQYEMELRTTYICSGLYYDGYLKGLKKVITVEILGFNIFDEGPYHERAQWRESDTNEVIFDFMQMHFIQLPKFEIDGRKSKNEKLWQWLTFIDGKNEEEVKSIMKENKLIEKAKIEYEKMINDEEVKRVAFLREKGMKDYNTNIDGAREEGEKNERNRIAINLIKEKLEIETIERVTGLKEEDIKRLAKIL